MKAKAKAKTASYELALSTAEFRAKLKALPLSLNVRKKINKYILYLRKGSRRDQRAYSDETITKSEYRLNNAIIKSGGSRCMGDYLLNMTRRRGMSSQDLSIKRELKDCAADVKIA